MTLLDGRNHGRDQCFQPIWGLKWTRNTLFRMCLKDLGLDAVDWVDVFDEEYGLVEAARLAQIAPRLVQQLRVPTPPVTCEGS